MNQQQLPLSHVFLVSDMDDTLLDAEKNISKKDLDAIKKLHQLGGHFTVATGRALPSFLPYVEQLPLPFPVILNNGGVIFDHSQGKIAWQSLLPGNAMELVEKTSTAFPSVGVVLYTAEDAYVFKKLPAPDRYFEAAMVTYHDIIDKPCPKHDWFKVLMVVEPEQMPKLQDFLDENMPEGISHVSTSPRFCELIPSGSSKGEATKKLCELYQITGKKIYGIGDYYNDIPLIEAADVGASVEHAPKEVQEKADIVFPTKDAIASFVEYIIAQETTTSIN